MQTRLIAYLPALLLAGCAMGPDFKSPAAPGTTGYVPEQPSTASEAPPSPAAASLYINGARVPNRWWTLFQCEALNALVDRALTNSPNALQARARLREAEENLTAQRRGTLYPSVDGQLGVTRQKLDPAAFGIPNVPASPPFTLYNAQVSVYYTLDVFGGARRATEGMSAQRDYQNYETEAAELTLAANVVAAAIHQADLQAQVELTEQLLQAKIRQSQIAEERYRAGGISEQDLHGEHEQVEQARAALAPLRAQRSQVDHLLAVYLGQTPAEARIPSFRLADLHLPAPVPLALPAELVRRRPDVLAYEALWHQASANVGVASANLFPALTLSGSAGSDRTNASDIVDSLNVWSVGAKLMQPIFHAGELRAQKRAAVAAYDAAAQAYEQTVLESLQQVADVLRARESDALVLAAQSAAFEQMSANCEIARQRFAAGGISEATWLDATRDKLQSNLARSRAQAQQLADTAALLHATAGSI